jgi:hypothetical protein
VRIASHDCIDASLKRTGDLKIVLEIEAGTRLCGKQGCLFDGRNIQRAQTSLHDSLCSRQTRLSANNVKDGRDGKCRDQRPDLALAMCIPDGPITQEQSKYHYYFAKSKTDLTPNPTNGLSNGQANFGSHLQKPSIVGPYLPNPLGIYDMHGNVWEWTDSSTGSGRVFRGGSWGLSAEYCTASYPRSRGQDGSYGNVGFRILAVPQGE